MSMQDEGVEMMKLVRDLIAKAPKMEGAPPDDPGAIECQIQLANGYKAVGSLTIDGQHDVFKFMCIAIEQGGQGRTIATTHYFPYDALVCVVTMLAIETEKPRIFTGQT